VSDVFAYLVSAFDDSSNPEEARHLAGELTAALNDAISSINHNLDIPLHWPTSLQIVAAKIPVQPASLPLPWQACNAALLSQSCDEWEKVPILEAILATVPSTYRIEKNPLTEFIAPYEGSLVAFLASLINEAQDELWVINPYWSTHGVERLQRRMLPSFKGPTLVKLLTSDNMQTESKAGCEAFKQWLRLSGSTVEHWVPLPLPDGFIPQMHAKVVIADNKHAYIGSANLSDNGLVRSIEIGVALKGQAVNYLTDWFSKFQPYLSKIDKVS